MKRFVSWETLSAEQIRTMRDRAKKKQKKYTAIGLSLVFAAMILATIAALIGSTWAVIILCGIGCIISTVGTVYCGMAVYCINNIRSLETKGRKGGGGFVWLIMFILGGIIVPMIVVTIAKNSVSMSAKILDWRDLL